METTTMDRSLGYRQMTDKELGDWRSTDYALRTGVKSALVAEANAYCRETGAEYVQFLNGTVAVYTFSMRAAW